MYSDALFKFLFFVRYFLKNISKTLEIGAVPQGLFNHISLVVMTFKCHTGLDTCVTTTPGASPYTSLDEQKSLLFSSIPEQSTTISGEQKKAGMSTKEPPKGEQ